MVAPKKNRRHWRKWKLLQMFKNQIKGIKVKPCDGSPESMSVHGGEVFSLGDVPCRPHGDLPWCIWCLTYEDHTIWCKRIEIEIWDDVDTTDIELLVEGHLDVGHAAVLHHGGHGVHTHRVRGSQSDFFHVGFQDSLKKIMLCRVCLESNFTWIFWIVSSEKSISGQRASNT